jgi:hypothetical protein
MITSLIICALTEYRGDKIEEDEIGRACGTFAGKREMQAEFWWGDIKKSDCMEDLGLYMRMILTI